MKYPVPDVLSPYVQEIWSTDDVSGSSGYRVLPGLVPVIGFQFRGRLQVRQSDQLQLLAPAGITGLISSARHFRAQDTVHSVLVRFTPFGAWALLGCAMDEIADRHIALSDLHAGVAAMEGRLAEAFDVRSAAVLVTGWLLERLKQSRRTVHPDLRAATHRIRLTNGREPVERVAAALNIGRRHLERLFQEQVGVSPKEFASIAQFCWVIDHLDRRRSWADVADAAGYTDQAHFIRSFKRRSGLTPMQYMRERSPAAPSSSTAFG